MASRAGTRTSRSRSCAARRPGPQRAPLLLRLGHVRYVSDDVRAAHELFQQALAETGDDLRLRAATEQALAFTAMYGGDIQAALAHARASLELAERLDDPGVLALAVSRVEVNEFLAGNGLHHERWEHALSLEDRVQDVPL